VVGISRIIHCRRSE